MVYLFKVKVVNMKSLKLINSLIDNIELNESLFSICNNREKEIYFSLEIDKYVYEFKFKLVNIKRER